MATREYPETIVLEPGSEEYDLLVGHSDLIDSLSDDIGGPLELSADLMFQGDTEKWKNFVDIFFPGLSGNPYFGFKKNAIFVLDERGGKEGLKDMLDFMMVDTPNTMMNFARQQARKQLNAPPVIVPRGEPRFVARIGWRRRRVNEDAEPRGQPIVVNNASNTGRGSGISAAEGNHPRNAGDPNSTVPSRAKFPYTLYNFIKGKLPNQRRSTRKASRKNRKTRRASRK